MKLFFDDNLLLIPSKEVNYTHIYSPHTHSIVKVSNNAKTFIDKIISIKPGSEFSLSDVEPNADLHDSIMMFLKSLVKSKIIFETYEDYAGADFSTHLSEKEYQVREVYIHLTQNCNLNCSYCCNENNLGKWDELESNEWMEIIRALKSNGVEKVVLTGGEPLLRTDIVSLSKFIKQIGLKLAIITNGTLLSGDIFEIIEVVDSISISLDSIDEDINDEFRVGSKNYKQTARRAN